MEPNEEETTEGDSTAQVVHDDESMDDTQLYVNTAAEVFEEEQQSGRGEVKRQPEPTTDAPPSKRRETKKELFPPPAAPRSYAEAVGSTSGSSDARGSRHAGGKAITPDARLRETLSRARRFIRPMSEVMSKDRERSPRREGGEEERA